jgi:hypothetical protein
MTRPARNRSWFDTDTVSEESGTLASRRFGYEAAIEGVLPFGFRVRGGWTFDPVGAAALNADPRAGDPLRRPFFVSGGDLAIHEEVIAVVHEGASVATSVDWTRGEVEGPLAPVLPYGLPFYAIRASGAIYRVGRIGIHVSASGTRVQVEHREVRQKTARTSEFSRSLAQRGVEIRVVQDVLRYPSSALRVLVSLESSEVGEDAVDYASRLEGERLPEVVQRVNAGVAVAF